MRRTACCLAAACLSLASIQLALAEIKPIPRVLPPTDGVEMPEEKREAIAKQLETLQKRLAEYKQAHVAVTDETRQLPADADVYLKAVAYALEFNEFYTVKDIDKAFAALKSAELRISGLESGKLLWNRQTGTVARGYYSKIDDSPQPYGLVIPDKHDFETPCPLYVWLHGRGDKATDLHFLIEREKSKGQITPPGAIVLHPFGRHCVGFKHAGEIDVLEAIDRVKQEYKIDDKRIVLIGFSMGGAGAWHLGAHYADKWAVVSPGAGFAETAKYTNTDPAKVPDYERTLWGLYDVPDYVRNLFNTRVIAYSGELDKQIQAARIMEAAYEKEGRKLEHLIGPAVEHKYEPKTLELLLKKIEEELKNPVTEKRWRDLEVQTRTARYGGVDAGLTIVELERPWTDSRASLRWTDDRRIEISTSNVKGLSLWRPAAVLSLKIDGTEVKLRSSRNQKDVLEQLIKDENGWGKYVPKEPSWFRKMPRRQGPIDDAFMNAFLVVAPTGKSQNPKVSQWVQFELAHFRERWRALMRADLPLKNDRDVTKDDIENKHLILWGEPETNSVLAQVYERLPAEYERGGFRFAKQWYDQTTHVPVYVQPNPLNPYKYVVLNSGLTFREAHDKTNSQQNPKLPDWAIIDITQAPDAASPGRIAAAGFFDEQWQVK